MSETTIAGEKINDFFLEKGTEFSKNYGYVSIKISQNALIPYKKTHFFSGRHYTSPDHTITGRKFNFSWKSQNWLKNTDIPLSSAHNALIPHTKKLKKILVRSTMPLLRRQTRAHSGWKTNFCWNGAQK